ncbi:conserved hypothetical protein [Desulfamplus magnetovallimortis]|uniref:BrnT family toxin n=1 Tax=Desulfamplus magnetovallimortis TaxID=1246637 RepID=A0A1W1H8K5_9BACT|nr:BrnT family toxin [Desulfamplus magnetovallimortis]SLM28801.1 conserved hypothetical protein [Desulfamplus magnetovallimortis]
MSLKFEWDPNKACSNHGKHGITFDDAKTVFNDPFFITFLDIEHSQDEERYITLGMSTDQRLLMIAHTEREEIIRIISARKATKNERRVYEEAE